MKYVVLIMVFCFTITSVFSAEKKVAAPAVPKPNPQLTKIEEATSGISNQVTTVQSILLDMTSKIEKDNEEIVKLQGMVNSLSTKVEKQSKELDKLVSKIHVDKPMFNILIILVIVNIFVVVLFYILNTILIKNQNKKRNYSENIPQYREQWINEYKSFVAEFLTQAEVETPVINDLVYMRNRIKMHLNFNSKVDNSVIDSIDSIINTIDEMEQEKENDTSYRTRVNLLCDELTIKTQIYFKLEWEKVKNESENGRMSPEELKEHDEKLLSTFQAEVKKCQVAQTKNL